MSVEIKECGDKLICTLTEHQDTLRSQELESELKPRLKTPQQVVFAMQDVTFVCSAFLRVCIFVAQTVGNDNFKLTGLTPSVKRVFMIAGLREFFLD